MTHNYKAALNEVLFADLETRFSIEWNETLAKAKAKAKAFDDLKNWLDDEIEDAKQCDQSDHNSYGAGLDYGIWSALVKVKRFINGEIE